MTKSDKIDKIDKMTKMTTNDKMVKFIKKSQKLMSTKNNLLTSRTAEQYARGQKMKLKK